MPYAVVADVAAVLRLSAGDVDDARIQSALDMTATLIDRELGRTATAPPLEPAELELARQANIRAAIDWYEAQRAPGGYLDVGDPMGTPGRLSIDPLAGVLTLLDGIAHPAGFA